LIIKDLRKNAIFSFGKPSTLGYYVSTKNATFDAEKLNFIEVYAVNDANDD